MPARNGKIARLPVTVRDQLNRRLHDGEFGRDLLDWLNSLPAVQEVLSRDFDGRPINDQNLSDWKYGGFADWVHRQDALAWIEHHTAEASVLATSATLPSVSDLLAAPLALALGRQLDAVSRVRTDGELSCGNPESSPSSQRRAILGLAHKIIELRRADLAQQRFIIERERWFVEQAGHLDDEMPLGSPSALLGLYTGNGPLRHFASRIHVPDAPEPSAPVPLASPPSSVVTPPPGQSQ